MNPSKTGPDADLLPYAVLDRGTEVRAEALPLQQAANTGEHVRDRVLEVVRQDGERFDLLCHATPLRDEMGHPGGAVGVFVDITDRNRIENELRRSNADLSQFAYAASHDLQEPLRMMTSFSQLLQRRFAGNLDDDSAQCLGYIVQGAHRMGSLLNDLLTYSRFENENRKPQVLLNCADVLDRVLQNLRSAIEESGAVIEVGHMPAVVAHEVHLVQLFQNLLGNALKYRRADTPPQIMITAGRARNRWMFSFTDNGIGIDPAHHDTVFGIFKRLHHGDQYAGTGIGLALCKRIVESYGGRVWVESTLGKGSVFRFTLPVPPS